MVLQVTSRNKKPQASTLTKTMIHLHVLWSDTAVRFLLRVKKVTVLLKFVNRWTRQIPGTSLALAIWDSALNEHHLPCHRFFAIQVVMMRLRGEKIFSAPCSSEKHKLAA